MTFWQSLSRPPDVSSKTIPPFLVAAALLVLAIVGMQLRMDYLVQHSWSTDAFFVANSTFSPVWEESSKVGLGLLVGYVAAMVSAVPIWISEGRSGKARSGIPLLSRRIWRWTSVIVFLIIASGFAVSEGLGDGNALKLLGHPGFSVLALFVALEGKPRTVWFVGLGYAFHSLVNLVLGTFTGWVQWAAYVVITGVIVVVDLLVMSLWYPSLWKKAMPKTDVKGGES